MLVFLPVTMKHRLHSASSRPEWKHVFPAPTVWDGPCLCPLCRNTEPVSGGSIPRTSSRLPGTCQRLHVRDYVTHAPGADCLGKSNVSEKERPSCVDVCFIALQAGEYVHTYLYIYTYIRKCEEINE